MILIIGAGLSGLLTAYRLKTAGIPFKIIEARSRIGGRIHTVYAKNNTGVEMGATWFTDVHQNLYALLNELEIPFFEQYMKGITYFQHYPTQPAQAIEIPIQAPSYRISGGSSNLIQTLYSKLNPEDILLNQTVREIKFSENGVKVTADQIFEGSNLVLAIPPKLWSKKIVFEPSLPQNLLHIAQETHTWMEDSIKIAVSYDEPFWQKENKSGAFFSNSGPITEFYDHSNHERSTFALCGFISTAFKTLNYEERKSRVINQLEAVFGEKATHFIDYTERVWSQEPNTFQATENLLFPHQNNGNPIFNTTLFNNKLFISSSEASREFAGYMDGAVFVANDTAKKIINKLKV